MGSGVVGLTTGAVKGTVGLGVGAVKWTASTSYGVVSKVSFFLLYFTNLKATLPCSLHYYSVHEVIQNCRLQIKFKADFKVFFCIETVQNIKIYNGILLTFH